MSGVEEVAIAIVEILSDLITEEEVTTLAGEVLIDSAGEEIVAGASDLLVGGVETWEEALAADAEAEAVPKELVEALDGMQSSALTSAQKTTLFSQARYFAAWVGKEILKGAVLQTAVETYHLELQKSIGKPGSPESAFVDLVGRIVEALKLTATVTKDWRQWTIKHYHQRSEYGIMTVENVVIYRFEVLRSSLADLDDDLQQLAPLVKEAAKAGRDADMGKLRAATVRYIQSCQDMADRMVDKERLMVRKKLEPRREDLQKAHGIL